MKRQAKDELKRKDKDATERERKGNPRAMSRRGRKRGATLHGRDMFLIL